MSAPSRFAYLALAIALHAAVLWGISFGPPAFISDESDPGESVEVGLVETAPESVSEPVPEPATPEPPQPETEPPPPEPEPPPPPPDAMTDPVLPPEPPAKPAPKPKPRSAPRTVASSPGTPASSIAGTPNAGSGQPRSGDRSQATWRNRVQPTYPQTAHDAKQNGRVLIVVSVSATGEAVGARIFSSSGFPALDQAALKAARASTFNPKQVLGIPFPDTLTIPYSFRQDAAQ